MSDTQSKAALAAAVQLALGGAIDDHPDGIVIIAQTIDAALAEERKAVDELLHEIDQVYDGTDQTIGAFAVLADKIRAARGKAMSDMTSRPKTDYLDLAVEAELDARRSRPAPRRACDLAERALERDAKIKALIAAARALIQHDRADDIRNGLEGFPARQLTNLEEAIEALVERP